MKFRVTENIRLRTQDLKKPNAMRQNLRNISKRLLDIVDSLPLTDGMSILEIGCGPGTAAREIAGRIKSGHILAIDRSAKAIAQAISLSQPEINSGKLSFRQIAIEDFEIEEGGEKFDLIFAVRVGALDGRHPEKGKLAIQKINSALKKEGQLFIDGIRQ